MLHPGLPNRELALPTIFMNDLPFWSLKLKAPRTVEAFGPPPHPDIAPASMHAVYEYEARGDMPPVRLTWYQGEDKPEPLTSGKIPQWSDGMLFVGTKGMILSSHTKHVLLPEKEFKDFKPPEPTIARSCLISVPSVGQATGPS